MAISSQEWSKLHPIRWKRYQKKSWLKLRNVKCKYCDSKVEYTGFKNQFCSVSCRKSHYKERLKAWRDAVHFMFILDKERTGCKDCGYHRYGGALDYHHIDASTKSGRVSAMLWYNKTKRYFIELAKCVLLCKNCHYERHSKESENGTI